MLLASCEPVNGAAFRNGADGRPGRNPNFEPGAENNVSGRRPMRTALWKAQPIRYSISRAVKDCSLRHAIFNIPPKEAFAP